METFYRMSGLMIVHMELFMRLATSSQHPQVAVSFFTDSYKNWNQKMLNRSINAWPTFACRSQDDIKAYQRN